MGVLLAPALGLIKGMGAYAAAHPIAAGAATGALSGGIQDGWEGALRGAALGGVTAGAGGMLGRALSRIGAPAAASGGVSPMGAFGAAAANAPAQVGNSLAGLTTTVAAPAVADDLVVTGTRPTPMSGAAPMGTGLTSGASMDGTDQAPTREGNSWGRPLGNQLVRSAVSQAMARGPNTAGAPNAGIIGNANPFGGGGGGAPPSGLSIKGSTAPDVFPWKRAAAA